MLFQPAELYDIANMKHEIQDAKIIKSRCSRRTLCVAASNTANNANDSAACRPDGKKC